ncbi:MAG TPA: hypothetical protein VNA67_08135 [Pseudonocardiaceae bacterium]|nr:hypothetical protein [Pseudonocardiaceae bacterium]
MTPDVITSTATVVNLRRAALIAAGLGVASFVVLAPMGYPLAAAFFCGGLGLGLLNTRLVQRSAARFAAKGDPSKRRFAVAVLGRLALITVLAVGLALALQPEGLGVFAGLAVFQLLMIFMASIPLLKELRRSGVDGQSGIKGESGAPV